MGGLTINRGEKPRGMLVADRRLYLTADKSQVVEAGDPAAAFLFTTPGYEIPVGEVERHGLALVDGRLQWGAEKPEAGEAEAEEGAAAEATDGDLQEGEAAEETEDAGGLPEDMPHRAELIDAGVESLDSLRELGDLTALPGIGKAKAADIKEYLAEEAD